MNVSKGDASAIAKVLVPVAVAFAVYWPAMHGGFIWDDRLNITGNPVMFSRTALLDIWTSRGTAFDYYPLTWSAWWLQWQAWRKEPFGS